MSLKTKIWIGVTLLLIFVLSTTSSYVYDNSVSMYNTAQTNVANYSELEQKAVTLYDAKYLTFVEQTKIANINKETFVEVTNIIMSARKDGQSLAWKWVTENQRIPYEEFTVFYKQLSSFVQSQYEELYAVEREKQALVKAHNIMLTVFPNNLFNHYLKIPKMVYKYGYISDSTKLKYNLK